MTAVPPPVFTVRQPDGDAQPVLVSIPHTGTFVPDDIASSFAGDAIRALPMTDWHLHHLYEFLPALGITSIYAHCSRFVVDLNRPPDSTPLYPGRYETGLVATRTFDGEPIFSEPPNAATVEQRRVRYHAPYHQALFRLLNQFEKKFGHVVLIDAHSVASRASLLHGELTDDIYLGDRDGGSCESWLIDSIDQSFSAAGLQVVRNAPYKGGYITAHYGQPPAINALQIEMCQRLYMDEASSQFAPASDRFRRTRKTLVSVFEKLLAGLPTSP